VNTRRRIGIHLERVICDGNTDPQRSLLADGFLKTLEVRGTAEDLARLAGSLGGADVHLVRRCGERTDERTDDTRYS
jgi:hypothetical protein